MSDKQFLKWIHARLIEKHGENPSVDYMNKLNCIAESLDESRCTPNVFSHKTHVFGSFSDFCPPNGWQPIETAPKDGTYVDLWVKSIVSDKARFGRIDPDSANRITDCRFMNGNWITWDEYAGDEDVIEDGDITITHWKPITKPVA
jgi:hypothetical protein